MESVQSLLLKKELKILLRNVGWDVRRLAKELCDDYARSGACDVDEEKEYEKIKKQLSRSSTKPEVWHRYIKFITEHRCNKQKYQYIPINENGSSEFDELANWIRDFTLQTDYSTERRKQHC
ncbi:hypothetical protein BFQ30_04060 [Haemophilus quentini]|uniref:Uncharacterized protein n=1 Tax=Haemophilus quentini TaxID=123834 RepID=A0ABX3BL57_9PAST|nr:MULTISPECIES: hypothetical protein [Haemophilus]NYA47292.1 hypothetical protein [Haemophilus haemolyticus]OEY74210.1 hypothetical protein BFQ30_04060 [Haemophilus quentini]OEY74291.1 hypothetical protein BFQ29_04505 [Haemophilus quentini]ORC39032.1 hypothetical protein BES36_001080 [Haemophilus quentini]